MENFGKWKLIKTGFWLGIGFMIPQLVVLYSGTALTMLAMPAMLGTAYEDEDIEDMMSSYDLTEHIKILHFKEQIHGKQLLILGALENTADKNVNTVELEAELMDKEGNFVYQCSSYISKKLKPGDIENFQITCGCGKNPLPDHATMKVSVVSAGSY